MVDLEPPSGPDAGGERELLRPEEEARRRERLARTFEVASHSGSDPLAIRWAVYLTFQTMLVDSEEPPSKYSLGYLREGLDARVWSLPAESELGSPQERAETERIREEATKSKQRIDAAARLQGTFHNWVENASDVNNYSDLFLKAWMKVTPGARDFETIGQLPETPRDLKPIEVVPPTLTEVEEVFEEVLDPVTREPLIDGKTRQPKVVLKRRIRTKHPPRDASGEVVKETRGYEGGVKEGEEALGVKVDRGLRALVDVSIAKSQLWILERKVFRGMSRKEVGERKRRAFESVYRWIGESDPDIPSGPTVSPKDDSPERQKAIIEKYRALASLGADEPIQERRDATRELIRNLIGGDEMAEAMVYKLFYIMQLATKFGVRGKEGDFKMPGYPASDDLIKLYHLGFRRESEAKKGRKAGPPSTVGRYPDLVVSFMDFVKVDDPQDTREGDEQRLASFWELWYERNIPFGDLPWRKAREDVYNSYMFQRWRANRIKTAIMKVTDWDLEREVFNAEYWRDLNKDLQIGMGMLQLGSEVSKGHSRELTERVIKEMKMNILGGAIICNMPTSFLKAVAANPPEVASSAQWDKRLNEDSKVVIARLQGVILRSGFLDEDGWKDCIKKVVEPRQGIKIEA